MNANEMIQKVAMEKEIFRLAAIAADQASNNTETDPWACFEEA